MLVMSGANDDTYAPVDREVVRREEPVRAEDDRVLALLLQLLPEDLGVRRDLPRQEDDVHVVPDPADERGEVGLSWLTDSRATVTPGLLQRFLHAVGQRPAVRGLIVDDHHVLRVEVVRDVRGVGRRLRGVVRNDAEEGLELPSVRTVRRRRR